MPETITAGVLTKASGAGLVIVTPVGEPPVTLNASGFEKTRVMRPWKAAETRNDSVVGRSS